MNENQHLEIITTIAHKGGVGKSLTLRLLYQSLARVLHGNGETRKLLLVDTDPQSNSGSRWLEMEPETYGKIRGKMPPVHPDLQDDDNDRSDVSDIWLQGMAPEPYTTANPLIDVVPAREIHLYSLMDEKNHQFHVQGIYQWLASPEIAEKYCAVFIDTPPTKGPLTQAALAAATSCYIPVEYEPYPVDGMDQMLHLVDSETMSRPPERPLQFLGIIANKVPTTKAMIYTAYREQLRKHPVYGPFMLKSELRDLAAFAETDAKTTLPGDVFDYSSRSHFHVLREAAAFCREIYGQLDAFSGWDLDFRKGQSFSKSEEGA